MRSAWRLLFAEKVDAERLVFVDEMGANVSLCPIYAWSRRGQRAFGSAPRNWGKNVTLLSSITAEGVGPCLAFEGPTTREVFEAYLEHVLVPEPTAWTNHRARQPLCSQRRQGEGDRQGGGCELVYLPPYSPDFNPIEQAFSKIKRLLRRAEARTRKTLIEAMGRALDAVPAQDVRTFFMHCGYRMVDQLL